MFEIPHRYVPVLRCVTRGLPNKKIAVECGLSISTVGHYVSELMALLALQTRSQLAVWGERNGYGPRDAVAVRPISGSTPAGR